MSKYVAVWFRSPHNTKMSTIHSNLTEEEVDNLFNFHESTFTDFPEENGVRSFTDPNDSADEQVVADMMNVEGLIEKVTQEITHYEYLLDDVGEEESDDFNLFTRKIKALTNILKQLEAM